MCVPCEGVDPPSWRTEADARVEMGGMLTCRAPERVEGRPIHESAHNMFSMVGLIQTALRSFLELSAIA